MPGASGCEQRRAFQLDLAQTNKNVLSVKIKALGINTAVRMVSNVKMKRKIYILLFISILFNFIILSVKLN